MTSIVKTHLSGGVDGRGIKVVATTTPGTIIHTALAGTADNNFDEVWSYVYNSSGGNVALTIEFGGTTVPDDNIKASIPPQIGVQLIVPGLVMQNGDVIRAFAGTANVLVIFGFVNRMTP